MEFKARNNVTGLDSRERGVCHFRRQSQLSWCPREQRAAGRCRPPVADLAVGWRMGIGGAQTSRRARAVRLHFCNPHQRAGSQAARQAPNPQSHRPVIIHILLSSHSSKRAAVTYTTVSHAMAFASLRSIRQRAADTRSSQWAAQSLRRGVRSNSSGRR